MIQFQHTSGTFIFDPTSGVDISIPIQFHGPAVSAFGAPAPVSKPYTAEKFVGAVERGGSCNCDTVEITPHCQGTHTEGIGHLLQPRLFVADLFQRNLFLAQVITISCEDTMEIDRSAMEEQSLEQGLDAVVIRTLPNDPSKKRRKYAERSPYLTEEAVDLLNEKKIQHLLVDFPSIDPISDNGALVAHRTFWNLMPGQNEIDSKAWPHKTVTELVFVPKEVPSDVYILDIQLAPMMMDAVPSRPILYVIEGKV